jgi:YVTN family beta-propeller protein
VLAKVAVGAGYVWLAYQDQLGQEDSGHGDPVLVHGVPEGGHVDLVTAYGDQVWVTDFLNGFLYQVDPDRSAIESTVELQVAPDAIAVGPGGLWVVSTSGRIAFEVDEESGVPDSPIPVGDGPVAVAVGAHTVWVANRDDDTVTRIDTETNTPTQIPVPGSPIALAVDPRTDAVWVYLV